MPAAIRFAVRLALVAGLAVSAAWPASAQTASARALYQSAVAREREARTALADPGARPASSLSAVRRAVAAFRRVVRSYPRSGYCDDALWRAGKLAGEAFARFGDNRDRVTARDLFTQLVNGYPSSQMVPLARGELDAYGVPGSAATLTIRGITPTAAPGRVDVSIDTSGRGEMSFTEARLENPPRYYVDVRGPALDPALRNRAWAVDAGPVTHVRVGQPSPSVSRVVLDTPDPADCRARQIADPLRIEISCGPAHASPVRPTPATAGASSTPMPPLASMAMSGVFVLPATPSMSPAGAPPSAVLVAPPVTPGIGSLSPLPSRAADTRAAAQAVAPLAGRPPGTVSAALPAPPAGAAITAEPPPPAAAEPPPPAPPARPDPAPAPRPATPVPAGAPAPAPDPLWSLPVDAATIVELPAVSSRAAQPADLPSPAGRVAPVESVYAGFVPRVAQMSQPAVAVAIASQFTTGDDMRTGGQPSVEPDFGIQLFEPNLAIGNLYADVNITRRDGALTLGRGVVRLDGLRLGGLAWSVDAGDTWNAPVVQDFGFTNLFAPPVTFQGVSVSGSSAHTFVVISGGRVTAQRNIFGTDSSPIGQNLYQGLFSHRLGDRLDLFGHGNHIDSRSMTLYTPLTDWSTDAGGGVRFRPGPTVELVADAGFSRFLRHGAPDADQTVSGLLGALWSFSRGWAQVNAQRYPIGRFPVYNYPYIDRQGVFASGEVDLGRLARAFGGAEYALSNLDREASTDATTGISPGGGARGYGGVRVSVLDRSMLTVRVDGGSRRIEPSNFGPGFESNTGVVALDWHSRFPRGSAFARYERRTNEDPDSDAASFVQHDLLAQVYLGFAGARQVFGKYMLSRRADRGGDGQTQWQVGAGAQTSFGPVYARVEGTAGRTVTWLSQSETPRQAISAGLSGQLLRATFLSVDFYLDHAPVADGSGSPWVTRTMVRLTRVFPFGSSRVAQAGSQGPRGGPSGRIAGEVFVDWNDNGEPDDGEESVGGVTIAIPGVASVVTGADGRFVASGVPTGEQRVALQLDSVPADYDPPAEAERSVTVARNQVATVAFGVLPLGTFGGMVYQDVDGDGKLGEADTPIDGAVLVMDDGSRTEITRGGRFTFDPVRMGAHRVSLLVESLPEGSQLTGPPTVDVVLTRGQDAETVVFLVKLEKRAEIRKVFPPKKK